MTEERLRALFALADIKVLRLWKLPNRYLGQQEPLTHEEITKDRPGSPGCVTVFENESEGVVRAWMADYRWRYERPSWLVRTPRGVVEIGWRKRVIEICWEETGVSLVVTGDNVTKDLQSVHAWSEEKALEYLKVLSPYLEA